MQRPINRIQPVGRPEHYVSFRALAPRASHWRSATCAEIDCRHWREGWVTRCDEATADGRTLPDGTKVGGQIVAGYIRSMSDRSFVEQRDEQGLTVFVFEAGQTCFDAATHVTPLERDPLFRRDRGDWRGLTPGRSYDRADQWVDDFAAHTDQLKHQLEG